jgi:hypothetical protein
MQKEPTRPGDDTNTPGDEAQPGPSCNFAALFDGPLDNDTVEDDEPSVPQQDKED